MKNSFKYQVVEDPIANISAELPLEQLADSKFAKRKIHDGLICCKNVSGITFKEKCSLDIFRFQVRMNFHKK